MSIKETSRPRVLHVVDTLGMGGAETWLMQLLRHWDGDVSAPQIDILATSGEAGLFDDEARALGARIHYLRYGRSNLAPFVREARRLLAETSYVAVHDHQDYASGWHYLLGLGVTPKIRVSHVHSPWIHMSANYAVSLPRKLTAIAGAGLVRRLATHVCGTSAEVLRIYGYEPGAAGPPKVSVVHCGFEVDQFARPPEADRASVLAEFGWNRDAKIVLFAGRLDRALEFQHPQNHKNSWLALHIVRLALERDPELRLLMAGAGESREAITAHIAEWGLSDKLRLLGVRRDIPRLMRASDALLFPSHQEGLGMVAVEAQAAGLPVLASSAVPRECVVVPELFQAVDLSAQLETWSAALLELLGRERIAPDLAAAAVRASAFSIESSADALRQVYLPEIR